jgi:hypothetical protein
VRSPTSETPSLTRIGHLQGRRRPQEAVLTGVLLGLVIVGAACGGGSGESVGTDELENGAVVSSKIADEAVTKQKLAPGAVGTARLEDESVTSEKLAPDAVEADQVADESLTGADIEEATLEGVDATTLNGSTSFVIDVQPVEQTSSLNANDRKGPVTATCPAGTTVLSGGAAIVTESGSKLPVALTASTSNAGNGWNAEALEIRPVSEGWGLRVVALCGVISGQ